MCDVHPIGECNEKLQKLIYTNESLKKENQSLKTEFRELKAESTRLKHGKSKLKETVKGLETELNTVRQLNIDLQKSIIEKTTERDSEFSLKIRIFFINYQCYYFEIFIYRYDGKSCESSSKRDILR